MNEIRGAGKILSSIALALFSVSLLFSVVMAFKVPDGMFVLDSLSLAVWGLLIFNTLAIRQAWKRLRQLQTATPERHKET